MGRRGPDTDRKSDLRRAGYAISHVLLLCASGVGMALTAGSGFSWLPERASPLLHHLESGVADASEPPDVRAVLDRYCVRCHNQTRLIGDLALDGVDASDPTVNTEVWEKVIRRLQTRTMPPIRAGLARPDSETYRTVSEWLADEIDAAWAANPDPNPGRIAAVHRLNRTEYNNAINDVLGLDIDVKTQLPGDETADGGFDNVAEALTISPLHMERYMSVARQVTRLATGLPLSGADSKRYVADDVRPQDVWMSEDLPLGSRGGMAVQHYFPVDGDYTISLRLRRNYAGYVRGMGWPQELDVRLDGELLRRFTVGGEARAYRPVANSYAGAGSGPGWAGAPEWEEYTQVLADADLSVRATVEAGRRVLGLSFPRDVWIEERVLPQPPHQVTGGIDIFNNDYMGFAGVLEVYIDGPYEYGATAKDTQSRREIFTCEPETESAEQACAADILSRMALRAFRRPVMDEEVQMLLEFFDLGKQTGGTFDHGIQLGLERILIDPDFLLRIYRDPTPESRVAGSDLDSGAAGARQAASGDSYALSDLEVASRLAFFLWSSIPDETLLDLAVKGLLTDPPVLREQVRRMLADARAREALVQGFAAQWLNLRILDDHVLHDDIYIDYDHNLRDAAESETTLFIESTLREDRSVLDLLRADYTYVNERLARHYEIPNVAGSHFRRVALPDLEERGGVLGHASLLAITSYPDRTSPVLRGKWILENFLGMRAPPPPPDVDTSLEPKEGDGGATTPSIRERLEQHRVNPACASCHAMLDPLGFALERYDAMGGYRSVDEFGNPVDGVGASLTGDEVAGLSGLREMLLEDEEKFVRTVTEKLLAYALGRELEYYDQPAVRAIVRDAQDRDYRWSSLIVGIVESPQFLRRAGTAKGLR